MQLRNRIFVLIVVLACVVGFYRVQFTAINPFSNGGDDSAFAGAVGAQLDLPDFSRYQDVEAKKEAFFSFLLPLVEQENQRIAEERTQLVAISRQLGQINTAQKQWLLKLAFQYRLVAADHSEKDIDTNWLVNKLLRRVDLVPPSLALAQAANESAWGTSRFAVEGNNLYGQWCFKQGCGLVPGDRPEGARYEVAKFPSPQRSVQRYIYNLNTHFAYQDFREFRQQQRQQRQPLSGKELAPTLVSYSTRGEEYVGELLTMIEHNALDRYDTI